MQPISMLQYYKLTMFAKPVCDRALYQAIKKNRIRSIVEIGMGNCMRAVNMIRTAQRFSDSKTVRYTGIDLFDGRPDDQPRLSLMEAHRVLNKLKAKTQLVPGEPHETICRIANSHVRTDLLVVSAGYDPVSLERSWFYVPRMIHSNSMIFVQDHAGQNQPFQCLRRLEIERLADKHGLRKPIAA